LGFLAEDKSEFAKFVALTKRHPSDKWATHNYTSKYFQHFQPLRTREDLGFLEIGVGGYENDETGYANPSLGGESLRFWRDYFPTATIFGIDIQDKSRLQEDRIVIFRGSQVDENFLRNVVKRIGALDIVIDDGSHINSHVIKTFKFLFPLLNYGGIYVIEDTQTSYWAGDYEGDSENFDNKETIMGFFKSLVDGLNHAEFEKREYCPTYLDRHIVSIQFYHNLIFVVKGTNDCPSNRKRE